MPDAVPSPLREQLAHAIGDTLYGARSRWWTDPGCRHAREKMLAAADAVLPLVEAAVAAERATLPPLPDRYAAEVDRIVLEHGEQVARDAYVAGYGAAHIDRDEAVAAERLRLHTQLRDLPGPSLALAGIEGGTLLWRSDVEALLWRAATPQPEEHP